MPETLQQFKEEKIIEYAERISIDYANLSGRESAHRAEFRDRVIEHLSSYTADLLAVVEREIGEDEMLPIENTFSPTNENLRIICIINQERQRIRSLLHSAREESNHTLE